MENEKFVQVLWVIDLGYHLNMSKDDMKIRYPLSINS